jgi:hypothetical protein
MKSPTVLEESRAVGSYLLMALLLFQGLSGIAGGIGLVGDPSGDSLQISLSLLEGTPFNDYLIPGLILLVVLGIAPLIALYGLWKQRHWGWLGSLAIGVGLIIWIGVQILLIGYQPQPPLQLIYGVLGIAIVSTALTPSVRNDYTSTQ